MTRKRLGWGESEKIIDEVQKGLVADGVLLPLEIGGADERLWADCDLASLAEHRIGDRTDPRQLDDARRNLWIERASESKKIWLPSTRDYEVDYWLVDDGGERAGTIALATSTLGGARLGISSLYTLPTYRRHGIAKRTLIRIREVLAARDLGIRIATQWAWQSTIDYYLRLGMWARGWKREIDLRWDPGVPRPEVEIEDRRATLFVSLPDRRLAVAWAEREGARLASLDSPSADGESDPVLRDILWDADSTLALYLAMRGWPLVRSEESWKKCRYSDFGPPESLAYKISIWEAWDKHHGWRVETPKIAGLEYPTWDEFQARWEREDESKS